MFCFGMHRDMMSPSTCFSQSHTYKRECLRHVDVCLQGEERNEEREKEKRKREISTKEKKSREIDEME